MPPLTVTMIPVLQVVGPGVFDGASGSDFLKHRKIRTFTFCQHEIRVIFSEIHWKRHPG